MDLIRVMMDHAFLESLSDRSVTMPSIGPYVEIFYFKGEITLDLPLALAFVPSTMWIESNVRFIIHTDQILCIKKYQWCISNTDKPKIGA